MSSCTKLNNPGTREKRVPKNTSMTSLKDELSNNGLQRKLTSGESKRTKVKVIQ